MSLIDAATLFVRVINNLKKDTINLHSPLEEFGKNMWKRFGLYRQSQRC